MPAIDWEIATPILAAVLLFLTGAGGLWVNNRLRVDTRTVADQKRSDDRIAALETALDKERAERKAERNDDRRNRRVLEDYVYELRGAIAATGAIPPDWPEELDRA